MNRDVPASLLHIPLVGGRDFWDLASWFSRNKLAIRGDAARVGMTFSYFEVGNCDEIWQKLGILTLASSS